LAEAKPVQAALVPAPAVETDVPVAVVADGAIEVQVVFDVLFAASVAVDVRLFVLGKLCVCAWRGG
jgi:hypothetical protein